MKTWTAGVLVAAIALLSGCRSSLSVENVSGSYVLRLGETESLLVLGSNGMFRQTPKGASAVKTAEGKWRLESGRIFFEGLQLEKDDFGKPILKPQAISGSFPIERGFNSITIVINSDMNFIAVRQD